MISMSSISSASGCAKYMIDEAKVEYYANEQVPSAWHGTGAELQGLAGREVTVEDLTKQLEGKVIEYNREDDLHQEKQLGRADGNGGVEHRAGWDMTFAAPKSVSIESEVFGDTGVRAAHEVAVQKAMQFLEDKAAQTRIGGEFVHTGNLTYATFEHATSRAGDPQTHTHVVIANATFSEGKAYSLSNEKMMEMRTTADAVYKNELANELQKQGKTLEFDSKGNFEIAGYSKENLDTFSKRNGEIKDALAERGMDKDTASHAARQAATLETRHDKDHSENALDHRDKWQKEAEAAGIKQSVSTEPKEYNRAEEMNAARESVKAAINHLSEREQTFSEKDLWKETMRYSQGQADTAKVYEAIREMEKSGDLIEKKGDKYTTKEAVEAEKSMASKLSNGIGAHENVMNNKEFDAALTKFEERKGFELSSEQRDAARMILTGDDKFQGVQGLAGTGKTTMLEFVKEAADSKGWEVKGFSNGGAQADKMQQESGIQSSTTARFIIDSDKANKDSILAQKALETLENNSGMFGKEPNFKDLVKGVEKGTVSLEFDSQKRAYYTDKGGNTWTKDLYQEVTRVDSANMTHAGLTNTTYQIGKDGTVFKSGGDFKTELAGHLRDQHNEKGMPDSFLGKVEHKIVDHVLSNNQDWQKCGSVESFMVKDFANSETNENRAMVREALEKQANIGGTNKVLLIADEAGMSGQREFNKILAATEQAGARAVFLGDSRQHQAVEAGKGFELAQNHMPMSNLGQDSIRRQNTDHTKDAVSQVLEGKHGEAVKSLDTKEIRSNQDKVAEKYEGRDLSKSEKQQMREEMKDAQKADNQAVIKELAKDYSTIAKESRSIDKDEALKGKVEGVDYKVDRIGKNGEAQRVTFLKDNAENGIKAGESGSFKKDDIRMDSQDKTLVITANNADRQALNNEIRNQLKDQGYLQDFRTMDTLSKTGLTKEDAARAVNFEKGQVVEFGTQNKTLGVEKGQFGEVIKTDSLTNTVTVKMKNGEEITFDPSKVKGAELYDINKSKEFATGDKVTFTKNDKDLDVKNGQVGTIEKIDGNRMTVKMESGDTREFNMDQFKHVDYAYAVTSHKSQGQNFDNVMVHHNTNVGSHNEREAYVNITRSREDVTYYTQNSNLAAKQSGQALDKSTATDTVKSESRELKATENVAKPSSQSTGTRSKDSEMER